MDIKNLASSAISGFITGGIGNIFSNIATNRQQKQSLEMMKEQYKLNQMAAGANQARAKDMWNYTSFPNQVKKLKEAGLNPALMYGEGGQGGSTAGAGTASGSGLGSVGMAMNPVNYLMISEAKLNEAKAEEAKANAAKTSGVDTDLAKANIDQLNEITDNAKKEGKLKDFEVWKTKLMKEVGDVFWRTKFINEVMRDSEVAAKESEEALNDKLVAQKMWHHLDEVLDSKLNELQIPKATLYRIKAETSEALQAVQQMIASNASTDAIKNALEHLGLNGEWGSLIKEIIMKLIPTSSFSIGKK